MFVFAIIFIFGLIVGSFLNVVICRLPEKRSVIRGRSACPQCKEPIKWFDLIPLVSFFVLKMRCRHCREKISWQYPLVEALTGLIFFGLAWFHRVNIDLANPFFYRDLVFFSVLLVIFMTDLKNMLIFDAVIFPGAVFAFAVNVFLLGNSANYVDVVFNLLSAGAVGAAFFFVQYWLSKGKWLGAGDIRLGLLIGLMLGWPNVLAAIFFAYILGTLVSVILLVLKVRNMKSPVPLGVFLTVATGIILLFGREMVGWYLGLVNG
jgi:prepilin signal peptidase PulO-like enzyme (type II secretory pathway)